MSPAESWTLLAALMLTVVAVTVGLPWLLNWTLAAHRRGVTRLRRYNQAERRRRQAEATKAAAYFTELTRHDHLPPVRRGGWAP